MLSYLRTATALLTCITLLASFGCSGAVPATNNDAPSEEFEERDSSLQEAEETPSPPARSSEPVDLGFEGEVTPIEVMEANPKETKPSPKNERAKPISCKRNADCKNLPEKPNREPVCRQNVCRYTTPKDAKKSYRCKTKRQCEKRNLNRVKAPGAWTCQREWCVFEEKRDLFP